MPHFKSIAEFNGQTDTDAPSQAEKALIAACRKGEGYVISTARPKMATKRNTIRADLVRLLITGGTPECGSDRAEICLDGA